MTVACIDVCIVCTCRVNLDDAEMVKARLRQHLLRVPMQVDACMDGSSRYMCCLVFVLQVIFSNVTAVKCSVCLVCPLSILTRFLPSVFRMMIGSIHCSRLTVPPLGTFYLYGWSFPANTVHTHMCYYNFADVLQGKHLCPLMLLAMLPLWPMTQPLWSLMSSKFILKFV